MVQQQQAVFLHVIGCEYINSRCFLSTIKMIFKGVCNKQTKKWKCEVELNVKGKQDVQLHNFKI
jgi:hypothetical protein